MDWKDFIEAYSGLDRDALHVHTALAVYVSALFIFRQGRRSQLPWLVVFALTAANEILDLRTNLRDTPIGLAFAEGGKDLINTMVWPTILLGIGRYTRLFGDVQLATREKSKE